MNYFTMDATDVELINEVFNRLFIGTSQDQRAKYKWICTSRKKKVSVQVIDPDTFADEKDLAGDWVTDCTRQHYYPRYLFRTMYTFLKYGDHIPTFF